MAISELTERRLKGEIRYWQCANCGIVTKGYELEVPCECGVTGDRYIKSIGGTEGVNIGVRLERL